MAETVLRRAVVPLTVLILALVTASAHAASPAAAKEGKLVVFAATSLQDVFAQMGDAFEKAHPGVDVTFNFAGSQELRTQLEHGAPVDVFASADLNHMDQLANASRVIRPQVFARNEPVIVVEKRDGPPIHRLADLPSAERIVVGVPEVPIGRYTLQILDKANQALGADFRARVEKKVVSRELNVRQVLAKVSLGEAQAGIVYRTDAASAADKVNVVTISPDLNVLAEYPIAVVAGAPHPTMANAWVSYVLSSEGQRLLRNAGFLAPARSATPE